MADQKLRSEVEIVGAGKAASDLNKVADVGADGASKRRRTTNGETRASHAEGF